MIQRIIQVQDKSVWGGDIPLPSEQLKNGDGQSTINMMQSLGKNRDGFVTNQGLN